MNTWINCSSGSYRFVSISTVYSSYSCRNKTTQISILPILVPSARKCKYDSLYWSWSNWIIELRWPSHVIWNYTVSLEWNFIISHGAFIQNLAQWCKDSIIETHLSLLWGVQWRQMWYLHPPHTHTKKKMLCEKSSGTHSVITQIDLLLLAPRTLVTFHFGASHALTALSRLAHSSSFYSSMIRTGNAPIDEKPRRGVQTGVFGGAGAAARKTKYQLLFHKRWFIFVYLLCLPFSPFTPCFLSGSSCLRKDAEWIAVFDLWLAAESAEIIIDDRNDYADNMCTVICVALWAKHPMFLRFEV